MVRGGEGNDARHRPRVTYRDGQEGWGREEDVRTERLRRRDLLRWVYITRIALSVGLFAGAAIAWAAALPSQTLATSLALVLTLALTPISYWYSHVSGYDIGSTFIYSQSIFDVLLVTLVVHLTGGTESVVAPLYILLISAYSLMLPFRGGLLVAALACMAYIADVAYGGFVYVDTVVALQLLIFAGVALVVGFIGTRLQETGAELTSLGQELEQLRLDTSDILGNIPTAVLTVDGAGQLAYANPAAEELLGIDADRWLGRSVLDELGRRSPSLRRALERTLTHRIPVASAEVEVRFDGEAVPVGISTALLERREGPPSVTAIMRDITDRKRIESLRQRAERLEAVAELSASLAHEIKNPLASISSSVQQLRLREDADDDDHMLSGLILKESDRLSRLLSDFIDFARVRVARSDRFDLRDVVWHALDVVRQHPCHREEIELVAKVGPEPVMLEGDDDLVHRVVANLLLNAVQAAPPGQRTRVEVDVELSRSGFVVDDMPAPWVALTVSDDGPGIDAQDLPRVFDPFFSTRVGGSGLGLAIVHRIVREHGGTVQVESSEGSGTRFTVRFPSGPDTNGAGESEEQAWKTANDPVS